MKNHASKGKFDLLVKLADYRILTPTQITVLHFRSKQVVHRAMRDLKTEHLVEVNSRNSGVSRGRPENAFSLSEKGIELLRSEGVLDAEIPHKMITADALIQAMEHQLLLNWFRIHLAQIDRIWPNLSSDFLSSTSPFHLNESRSRSLVTEHPGVSGQSESGFTPDGSCCVNRKSYRTLRRNGGLKRRFLRPFWSQCSCSF
ncbi:replication-relaxation family protein, partial [Candidatus Sumerlaeota bacterium]|nr:replication-relaxation family protein [Candidatus Sumerlaeota bacterium]